MSLDISVRNLGTPIHGNLPPAPRLPRLSGQLGLAADTNSAVITVAAPVVLALSASVKMRIDVRAQVDAASLNPATSPDVLDTGVHHFTLGAGSWLIKWAAWS